MSELMALWHQASSAVLTHQLFPLFLTLSAYAVATWLYVEMLEAGFTSVCEFHYVHHDRDGRPYADDATLAHCLLRAAKKTGIGMTLLPVLYQTRSEEHTSELQSQR